MKLFEYRVNDMSIETIKNVIDSYELNEAQLIKKSRNYYNGEQDIYNKQVPEGRPNSKVVVNFIREIVDTYAGYINIGDAITDNEWFNDNIDVFAEVVHDALASRVGYLLFYYDQGLLRCSRLDNATTVILYDSSIAKHKLGAVTWVNNTIISKGMEKDVTDIYIYTDRTMSHYQGIGSKDFQLYDPEVNHFFPICPIVEVHTNSNYEGVADSVLDLQDAVNTTISSYLDSRETFSNAYLVIQGIGISEESSKELIDSTNRILNLPVQGASASYLTKPDSATDIIAIVENFKSFIYLTTNTPDFSDPKFGTYSGTAMSFKLTAFINACANIQSIVYNSILEIEKVLQTELNFSFRSIIPADIDMITKQIKELDGIIDRELLCSQLPIITDPATQVIKVAPVSEQAEIANLDEENI